MDASQVCYAHGAAQTPIPSGHQCGQGVLASGLGSSTGAQDHAHAFHQVGHQVRVRLGSIAGHMCDVYHASMALASPASSLSWVEHGLQNTHH
eukprot:1158635-Pelagomonas_calceolata.AAC.1